MPRQDEHTRGRWKVDDVGTDILARIGRQYEVIAHVFDFVCPTGTLTLLTAKANARLMAAAPDLLAAILNSDDAHWTPAMRAAIAKAIGRTENEQTSKSQRNKAGIPK
jgi:hypothetical protein